MAAWPSSLPQSPDLGGYSETPQSQILRTSVDAGPVKTRRRFTAAGRTIPVQYTISKAQMEAFEAWFDADLAGGSLPFYLPHTRQDRKQNLLTYSQEFDNAAWAATNASVTANAAIAPDGTLTADKPYPTAANPRVPATYAKPADGALVTASVHLKAAEFHRAVLFCDSSTAAVEGSFYGSANFIDLVAGTAAGATEIELIGDGWYRCWLTWTIAAGGTNHRVTVVPMDDAAGSVNTVTPAGTSGVYTWGAQLNEGTEPTDYWPRAGADTPESNDLLVQIAQPYTLTPLGGQWWRLGMQLEVQP